MKKLMIVAVIVCAAAFVHAGCYTWGLTSGNDHGSKAGSWLTDGGFTVMLFTGTIGENPNDNGTYTLDFSQANYVTKTSSFDPQTYGIGELNFDAGRTSDHVTGVDKQAYSMLVLDTGAGITDYAKYEGTYAIVSGDGALNTDPEAGLAYTEFKSITAVQENDYRTAAGGGEPVPEPTSGLLLILGVAGMALRRRRM